ncbi:MULTISPECIES: DUF6680 family protein [unclassified Bradyrhizobium]
MQFKDWLNLAILVITAIAIVVGPIVAVRLTLRLEEVREKRRDKYRTFHALMRTRRVTLAPDHVTALNVIQTEFHDDEKVIAAYKKYIDNLGGPLLPPNSSNDEIKKFVDARDDAFNDMMFEIGKHLGYSLDKRELARYSYAPQAWVNVESEQNAIRSLAIELLLGKRSLAISPFQPSSPSDKFPPPPTVTKT